MAAATYNITIDQGSDFALALQLQQEDGTADNLTGYLARAQLRQTKSAATITATFTCTIPTPTNGIIAIELGNGITKNIIASSTAGKYFFDVEIYTDSDVIVKRVLQGDALVTQEVTR